MNTLASLLTVQEPGMNLQGVYFPTQGAYVIAQIP